MLDRFDRMIRWFVVMLVLVTVVSTLLASHARAAGPLVFIEIQVESERARIAEDGRRLIEREPVREARPGQVLVYTLKAVNQGDGPALDARIEDPVPVGTVLLLDSLDGVSAPTEASLDGGRTWQSFPALVDGEDEPTRPVPAPPEAYTHLRWVLDGSLGPGESRDISFKVRVQ